MKDCCCWRKLPIQRFKTVWLKSPRWKLYDRHHKFVYQFCWKRGLNDTCHVWRGITSNRPLNNHPISFKDFLFETVFYILVIYSKIRGYRLPSSCGSIQVWFLCMYVFVFSYIIIRITSILIWPVMLIMLLVFHWQKVLA